MAEITLSRQPDDEMRHTRCRWRRPTLKQTLNDREAAASLALRSTGRTLPGRGLYIISILPLGRRIGYHRSRAPKTARGSALPTLARADIRDFSSQRRRARGCAGRTTRARPHRRFLQQLRRRRREFLVAALREVRAFERARLWHSRAPRRCSGMLSVRDRELLRSLACIVLTVADCRSSTRESEITEQDLRTLMILPQVHLRKPCYDFYFL